MARKATSNASGVAATTTRVSRPSRASSVTIDRCFCTPRIATLRSLGTASRSEIKSFSREFPRHMAEARHITAWPGDACDQAFAIRIGHTEEDDGYSCAGFLDGAR